MSKKLSSYTSKKLSQKSLNVEEIKENHEKFMATYKVNKCKEKANHDRKMCNGWHGRGDKRRNPFEIPYVAFECPNSSEIMVCPLGDKCLKAHNTLEKMFHPDLYKISMCQKGSSGGFCERASHCAFAHSEEDHRVPSYITANKNESGNLKIELFRDKIVELIKLQGNLGILSSDFPKKFYEKYSEKIEFNHDEMNKIKDITSTHTNIITQNISRGQFRLFYNSSPDSLIQTNESYVKKIDEEENEKTISWASLTSASIISPSIQKNNIEIQINKFHPNNDSQFSSINCSNIANINNTVQNVYDGISNASISKLNQNGILNVNDEGKLHVSMLHDNNGRNIMDLNDNRYSNMLLENEKSMKLNIELSHYKEKFREMNDRLILLNIAKETAESMNLSLYHQINELKNTINIKDHLLNSIKSNLVEFESKLSVNLLNPKSFDLSSELDNLKNTISSLIFHPDSNRFVNTIKDQEISNHGISMYQKNDSYGSLLNGSTMHINDNFEHSMLSLNNNTHFQAQTLNGFSYF